MNLSAIFQLRTKRFWWMDVIFYFVISLFVATVLCYGIFLIKNSIQKNEIQKQVEALKTVGTEDQKAQEEEVLKYQSKINTFTNLFENHEFASNIFAFMQMRTMPNIWFRQFNLDRKNASIQLSGECDDLDALSRQVADFEKNEYVKNIGGISSSLGESTRINFSFSLTMDPKIFSYIYDMAQILQTVFPIEEEITEEETAEEITEEAGSNQNLITAFHILLDREVIGAIDQKNYTILVNVPFGTDVKNLNTSIVVSPDAVVSPESGVAQDFTNPVDYIVTAQDGTTQNYKVSVNVLPEIVENQKKSGFGAWVIALIVLVVILGCGLIGFFAWKKFKSGKNKNLNIQ